MIPLGPRPPTRIPDAPAARERPDGADVEWIGVLACYGDEAFCVARDGKVTMVDPSSIRICVNRCDCPGCAPRKYPIRSFAAFRARTAQPGVASAIRHAGLNTPDRKKYGVAQYRRT